MSGRRCNCSTADSTREAPGSIRYISDNITRSQDALRPLDARQISILTAWLSQPAATSTHGRGVWFLRACKWRVPLTQLQHLGSILYAMQSQSQQRSSMLQLITIPCTPARVKYATRPTSKGVRHCSIDVPLPRQRRRKAKLEECK